MCKKARLSISPYGYLSIWTHTAISFGIRAHTPYSRNADIYFQGYFPQSLSHQTDTLCLYMPIVHLHTPGLSIDSDFQHNPQSPFTPLLGLLVFVLPLVSCVWSFTSPPPPPTSLHPEYTARLSRLRSIIPTTKLHDHMHTSASHHIYDSLLSLCMTFVLSVCLV